MNNDLAGDSAVWRALFGVRVAAPSWILSTCQKTAANGFGADVGSVSGDGRSSRCCTLAELLRDCDLVSVMAVQEKCDEKRSEGMIRGITVSGVGRSTGPLLEKREKGRTPISSLLLALQNARYTYRGRRRPPARRWITFSGCNSPMMWRRRGSTRGASRSNGMPQPEGRLATTGSVCEELRETGERPVGPGFRFLRIRAWGTSRLSPSFRPRVSSSPCSSEAPVFGPANGRCGMPEGLPQWGREGRRFRREQARQLAKEILQSSSLGKGNPDRWTIVFGLIALAAGFGSWAYFAMNPEPNIYFGSTLVLLCLVLLAAAFWVHSEWKLKVKLALVLCGLAISGTAASRWILHVTRPSFVFITPGPVVAVRSLNDSWDFIINHRGPKSSESVQVLFVDKDRQHDVLQRSTTLSRQDLDSYERMLNIPEVNPKNRGNIFAEQFIWTPLVMDHEHYQIDITAKDRTVHQELQIEKVNGAWLWATQITDRESGKRLVNCKDTGFPYGDNDAVPCQPIFSLPSD
jgi:hypothetical protein